MKAVLNLIRPFKPSSTPNSFASSSEAFNYRLYRMLYSEQQIQ